jgi:hypothetical protein
MNNKNISCLSLPEWCKDLLLNFGGLRKLDTIGVGDIGAKATVDCLMVYEEEYFTHKELLVNALKEKHINTLVIFNHHVFFFDDKVLDELDSLSVDLDIHILANGHYAKKYENIKTHHFEQFENSIGHHFNLLLSTRLQARKNPEKTFLVQTIEKDQFRKTVMQGIRASQINEDVIALQVVGTGRNLYKSSDLYKLGDSLLEFVKEKYPNNIDAVHSLNSFGNGIPNFSLYEKAFCEVVLETKNTGSYHFTEKLFRPIALRVPVVFLGSKSMHDKLNGYGYRFYDNDFYRHWHNEEISLTEKVDRLITFMQHINEDPQAKEKLTDSADSNYRMFWNGRKLHYYKNWNDIFDQICKGKCIDRVVEGVYSKCNF